MHRIDIIFYMTKRWPKKKCVAERRKIILMQLAVSPFSFTQLTSSSSSNPYFSLCNYKLHFLIPSLGALISFPSLLLFVIAVDYAVWWEAVHRVTHSMNPALQGGTNGCNPGISPDLSSPPPSYSAYGKWKGEHPSYNLSFL